jgi:NADH-quinone oxidoreductase subunit A
MPFDGLLTVRPRALGVKLFLIRQEFILTGLGQGFTLNLISIFFIFIIMLESYLPILILMTVAVLFAVVNIIVSTVLGPKRPTPEKLSTYESGVEPVGTAHSKFSVKYYLVAMLFIVFDIEIVFMYPWAVTFRSYSGQMLTYALIEMIVFILLLFIGLIYIFRKGSLKWN